MKVSIIIVVLLIVVCAAIASKQQGVKCTTPTEGGKFYGNQLANKSPKPKKSVCDSDCLKNCTTYVIQCFAPFSDKKPKESMITQCNNSCKTAAKNGGAYMSSHVAVDTSILENYQKNYRISRNDHSMAMLLKINLKEMKLEVEEEYREPDTTLEAIAEELEESNPRFIVYSYKWVRSDKYGDRKQFPINLIYYTPEGSNPINSMVYTRTKAVLLDKFLGIQRSYDVRDKDTLSDKWLLGMLNKA